MQEPEYHLIDARLAEQEQLAGLQHIMRIAFTNEMPEERTLSDIDTFVNWNNTPEFYRGMNDPNLQVGKQLRADQQYWNPTLAVATVSGLPVGFAYAANNVSGKYQIERWAKRASVIKNFLWLRNVVVHPDFQGNGIATKLVTSLLSDAKALQPVSAYVYREETPDVAKTLERHAFRVTGVSDAYPFGSDAGMSPLTRMEASSVRAVLRSMQKK